LHNTPGRWCHLSGQEEVSELEAGLDFRKPEYRRETFLRFYEFHLKYHSHPGCIYYLLPFLSERYGWDAEARLWFAFINGNTQNPVTSLLIFRRFPDVRNLNEPELRNWFDHSYGRLAFDTDRRYHKKSFPDAVACYRAQLAREPQWSWFRRILEQSGFSGLWDIVWGGFYSFGRLSAFSYLEYLRICGLDIVCDTLFLEDLTGSMSHRNGLAKVLGRDDLDWHESNPTRFTGQYTPEVMKWLIAEAATLLSEAQERFSRSNFARDVNYFTLESALCTYKSWHRPNRRYPSVYNDMLHYRIRESEKAWPEEPLDVFWEARRASLPVNLRLEDSPGDPGLCPEKQNWYLKTGEPIMMDQDWPCFENAFNTRIRLKNDELRKNA
jgi:hypothetical protein